MQSLYKNMFIFILHFWNCNEELALFSMYAKAGLLKLWSVNCKLVQEPSHVGCQDAICKKRYYGLTSVRLPTKRRCHDMIFFTGPASDLFKIILLLAK